MRVGNKTLCFSTTVLPYLGAHGEGVATAWSPAAGFWAAEGHQGGREEVVDTALPVAAVRGHRGTC